MAKFTGYTVSSLQIFHFKRYFQQHISQVSNRRGGAVTEILVREIIPRLTCNPTLPLCSSPDTHWLTCRPQTYPNSYGLGMRSDQLFQHQNPLAGQHLDKTSIYPYTVNVLTFVSTHFHELYALRKNLGDFYFRSCRRSTQNFSI